MDQVVRECVKCHVRCPDPNSADFLCITRTQRCIQCALAQLLKESYLHRNDDIDYLKSTLALFRFQADQSRSQLDEKDVELQNLKSSFRSLRLETDECQRQLGMKDTQLAFLRLDQPDDKSHTDVVIVVQDRTDELLHTHKSILARKSPVFRTMFNVNMSEEATGVIHINDATLPVIRAMINFCYNAEIDFTHEVTAEEVLEVAHKYQINLLQDICQKHLIQTIDSRNLAKRLRLATRFHVESLEAVATEYLKSHYDQAIGAVLEEFF